MIPSPSRTHRAHACGLTLALCTALLSAVGCKKETPAPAETKTEAKEATPTEKKAKRSANTNKDEGVEVPTEEDFEEAVAKQITPTSDLGKELDLLEKQIQGQ